jgi:hypothetical protein
VLTVVVEVMILLFKQFDVCKILCMNNSGQNCETVSIEYYLFFFLSIYVSNEKTLANARMYAESISAS